MSDDDLGKAIATMVNSYDEEALIKQLAMRVEATKENPAVAGSYDPAVAYDFEHAGLSDSLLDLGGRILHRWERELYGVVCGDAKEDAADRNSILTKIAGDDIALGAAVGGVLISLGVGPAVAVVVAALVIKRIIHPAGNEVCKMWSERLKTVC
jgi:hypothetical protein